jgi:HEAT repeat protein
MGFLDFLFDKEKAEQRKIKKLKKTVTHMYVQPPERRYAIQTLRDIGSPDAVRAILARFEEMAPNTTVDAEDKNLAYDTLVGMAADPDLDVRGIIVDYLRGRDEKINWPMKVLSDLMDYDEFIDLVRELLETCGNEYKRNPEKKQELILRAADLKDEALTRELLRFLDDPNETIRFLAVDAVLNHGFDDIIEEPLRERLREEESLRIVKKLADAFAKKQNWKIPEDAQEDVEQALPDEFGVHKKGHIYQRRT